MIKKIFLTLVVLFIIAVVGLYFFIDSIASKVVKEAINTVGPQATQTAVSVDGVGISVFSGNLTICGLKVGNTASFQPPENAFTLGEIHVDIEPSSVMTDTIIVNVIRITEAKFNYNTTLSSSNLQEILDNVKQFSSKDATAPAEPAADGEAAPAGESKKLVIKSISVIGATASATVLGQSVDVAIPDINVKNDSPEGIDAAQVVDLVLSDVLEQLIPALTDQISDLAKDPMGAGKKILDGVTKGGGDGASEAVDAIKNMF